MKPARIRSRIFLDGCNPEETQEIIHLLGFLDGQTTNPTLLSRNPYVAERIRQGTKFKERELLEYYQVVVSKISSLLPLGSVSIEVYADALTSSGAMLSQGRAMFSWIPNAHIKFPTTASGLEACKQAVKEAGRVNMTLCFSQNQAAAVYAASRGAQKGQVFVSPFVGRLDDRDENGMDLIANIIRMYQKGGGQVEVLTASVRNVDHILYALALGSDIITAPFKVLKDWAKQGLPTPDTTYQYAPQNLQRIPYADVDLGRVEQEFDIWHELTDKGIERFSQDWNALVERT